MAGDANGYIPLSRRIFEHEFWKENREYSKFEAWLDMIQMAAHGEHERIIGSERIPIARGEVLASVRYLALRWGWSKRKVERYLATLARLRQVGGKRPTAKGDIYLLLNYETYNPLGDTKGTGGGQEGDRKGTKEKKGNKGKKEEPPSGVQGVELPPELDNPEGRQAVEEWVAYKKQRGEAYKPLGLRELLRELAAMGATRALAAVKHSMAKNWAGCFEPSPGLPFNRGPQPDIRRTAGANTGRSGGFDPFADEVKR